MTFLNLLLMLLAFASIELPWEGKMVQRRVVMAQNLILCPVYNGYQEVVALSNPFLQDEWRACQSQCMSEPNCYAWQCIKQDTDLCLCTLGSSAIFDTVDGIGDRSCPSKQCEDHIDCDNGCSFDPCVRGTCTNSTNDYVCNCPTGWQGKNCDDIDDCAPNPCANGGTCSNQSPGAGYTCDCRDGWEGQRCDEDVDDCAIIAANECVNGECVDTGLNSYRCDCDAGWVGESCNEVASPSVTQRPTAAPSARPTGTPTATPTSTPTSATPTVPPTATPTAVPTSAPSSPPRPAGECPGITAPNVIFQDRGKCERASEYDVCQLECEPDHISLDDTTRRSGFFVCEEDGTWSPSMPMVQPLDCQPLCRDVNTYDLLAVKAISHCPRLSGSKCELWCDPGYTAVRGTFDKLECNDVGEWTAMDTGETITEVNFLRCVPETCSAATLNIEIRFFDCDFNDATTVYTSEVAYAVDKELQIAAANNGSLLKTVPLSPGINTYLHDDSGVTYNFTVVMAEPSTDAYLQELNLALDLSVPFDRTTFEYEATLPQYMGNVTLNPIPVELGAMFVTLFDTMDDYDDAVANVTAAGPRNGPFQFRLPSDRNQSVLLVRVVAQDATATASATANDYFVTLTRSAPPRTCGEQLICEAMDLGAERCGISACEATVEVAWPVLLGLGGLVFVMWIVAIVALGQVLPRYPILSEKMVLFFIAIFDTGNSIVFLSVLFGQLDFAIHQWVALACFVIAFLVNVAALVYTVHREKSSNPLFAEWLSAHRVAAGLVAFFSLNNCESLTVLTVGKDVGGTNVNISSLSELTQFSEGDNTDTKERKMMATMKSEGPNIVAAPLSVVATRTLQLISWVGFALSNLGLFGVQLALIMADASLFQIGEVLIVVVAVNMVVLLIRTGIYIFRTCAPKLTNVQQEKTQAVVVAQLNAELRDAEIANDAEACAAIKKRIWRAEAGVLTDREISEVIGKLQHKLAVATASDNFAQRAELSHHVDTLRRNGIKGVQYAATPDAGTPRSHPFANPEKNGSTSSRSTRSPVAAPRNPITKPKAAAYDSSTANQSIELVTGGGGVDYSNHSIGLTTKARTERGVTVPVRYDDDEAGYTHTGSYRPEDEVVSYEDDGGYTLAEYRGDKNAEGSTQAGPEEKHDVGAQTASRTQLEEGYPNNISHDEGYAEAPYVQEQEGYPSTAAEAYQQQAGEAYQQQAAEAYQQQAGFPNTAAEAYQQHAGYPNTAAEAYPQQANVAGLTSTDFGPASPWRSAGPKLPTPITAATAAARATTGPVPPPRPARPSRPIGASPAAPLPPSRPTASKPAY